MIKSLCSLAALIVLFGMIQPGYGQVAGPAPIHPRPASPQSWPDTIPRPEKYVFTDIVEVPHTGVKSQIGSTCWDYAALGMLESEVLRQSGDSLDLSELWINRHAWFEKAVRYVRMNGKTNFAEGGLADDVVYLIDKYGIVPEYVYPAKAFTDNAGLSGELRTALKAFLDAIITSKNKTLSTVWMDALTGILDAYFGPLPENFEAVVPGTDKLKVFNPQSYAEALNISKEHYLQFTSFMHHPFYTDIILEIPDNWNASRYLNVPYEQLTELVDASLQAGYTVTWLADVSEPGFQYHQGFAILPYKELKDIDDADMIHWTGIPAETQQRYLYRPEGVMPERKINQELRQIEFDNQDTTDDHGMLIVGKATDQYGNPFYKVQNSWGESGEYKGYLYVSPTYLLMKTTGLFVNKITVPQVISSKLPK